MRSFHQAKTYCRLSIVALPICLAACNPPQPLNFSVQNVQTSPSVIDADLKSVTVTPASPTERTGALPPGVAGITTMDKEAIEEALARAAIFNDNSPHHVSLEVKVLKLDAPSAGFTFPTFTDARYTLLDRATGQPIFSEVITSEGETPVDFAFVGAIRARESINRSVSGNIANFIEALEKSPTAHPRSGPVATSQNRVGAGT